MATKAPEQRSAPVVGVDGPADIVFHSGNIFTMDDKNPQVEALAVKGEKILALGKCSEMLSLVKSRTKVVDLQGKTLLPGLIEAHSHAIILAETRHILTNVSAYSFDCKMRSKEEIIKIVKDEIAAVTSEDTWCMFIGWDIELQPELPTLTAKYLDENFSSTIPLVIMAQSGHAAWVNSRTFNVCGIRDDTPSPDGGTYVKVDGKLTGLILEQPAISSILNKCPKGLGMAINAAKSINEQWRDYSSRGFTTVTDMAYSPELAMDLYLSAKAHFKDCPIRVALYSTGGKSHIFENNKLWVAGCKFWADGSPHAGTSAIADPYLDNELTKKLSFPPPPNNCGILNWPVPPNKLYDMVKKCHDNGKQVAIHAHGERAIDQSLEIYGKLMKPEDDRRHRLEHVGLITEEQLQRCREVGVNVSMFVDQIRFYGKTFSDPENGIFGLDRTERWAPLSTAIKHLGKISIHQDHPTFPGPPMPFANMKSAITRTCLDDPNKVYGKNFCILIGEALKAYTIWPAHQLFREKEIGSLEVGKYADLVVLSANPYEVDPMKFDTDIEVLETYIGGQCNNIKSS